MSSSSQEKRSTTENKYNRATRNVKPKSAKDSMQIQRKCVELPFLCEGAWPNQLFPKIAQRIFDWENVVKNSELEATVLGKGELFSHAFKKAPILSIASGYFETEYRLTDPEDL